MNLTAVNKGDVRYFRNYCDRLPVNPQGLRKRLQATDQIEEPQDSIAIS